MLATMRNRNFAQLWVAGFISLTGDWMLQIALPIYVFILTGSVLVTTLALVAGLAPVLLLGSLAGVFVDRWNRRTTLVICNLLQAVALLPLLFVRSADTIWIVYAVSAVESTVELFFRPAESALLPRLVDAEHLVSANSLASLNSTLARLIGPVLGGVVAGALHLGGIVAIDAATFLVSAALIALISRAAGAPEPQERARKTSIWRELLEGLRLVRQSRVVAVLVGVAAITGLGEGIFAVLIVVWVRVALHGGAVELGWLMSAQAVGGLLGGLLVGFIGKRVRPARLAGVCALIFGALDLIIVNAPLFAPPYLPPSPISSVASSLTLFVIGLFVAVGIPGVGMFTGVTTLTQSSVQDAFRGRLFALGGVVVSLMGLLGLLLAGLFAERIGVITMLNGQGSLYILAGLALLLSLGRLAAPKTSASAATPLSEPAIP